eukprot:c35388_g1_i1.p1 GENE.c35388_g1_i1~~c35388_g1_i1.p1  ORF type:complete len:134 (+),score=19.93 c35388_g1_i1:46-447(+)
MIRCGVVVARRSFFAAPRLLAKQEKKEKGAASKGPKKSAGAAVAAGERVVGPLPTLDVTKEGWWSTGWQLKPDGEYPEWLWTLADPEPNLEELKKMIVEAGHPKYVDTDLLARYVKLHNRNVIKTNNSRSAKK